MDDVPETIAAIVAASKQVPLSIVMIGVGDGPWGQMDEFDDEIDSSAFDNFQFVNYTKIQTTISSPHQRQLQFALDALMELPEQYRTIKKMGLLSRAAEKKGKITFNSRLKGKHLFPSSYVHVQPGEGQ